MGFVPFGMAATDSIQSSCPNDSSKSRILDMELDVNDDSREVDSLAVGKKVGSELSSSAQNWKMGMISLISSFFSGSLLTWDILFKLIEKEMIIRCVEKYCIVSVDILSGLLLENLLIWSK